MDFTRYFLLLTTLLAPLQSGTAEIHVDAAHPGGNIAVSAINGTDIEVKQQWHDAARWWFYWNMRVQGAAGQNLTFNFLDGNVIGTRGPACSLDLGKSWTWLGTAHVKMADKNVQFTYQVPDGTDSVLLAFAPPYLASDLERFLQSVGTTPQLRVEELCRSEEDRTVERIHVGRLDGPPKYRLFITARHHACESMASYVLEGILAAALADTEDGAWFRKNVDIVAIPFVDKDGVENGEQGKNRIPRDHGRDYAGDSMYNSTGALRDFVPEWSDGRLDIAMDLHCPHIRGDYNEFIYQVGQEDPVIWKEQQAFAEILAAIAEPPLPYQARNDLPYGQAWNTGKNYTQGMPMARWASQLPGIRLATTFEIPYANVGDVTITTDRARAFGATLTTAMRSYLESHP